MKIKTIITLLLVARVFGCSSTYDILNHEPGDNKLTPILVLEDTTSHPITLKDATPPPEFVPYEKEPTVVRKVSPTYPPLELVFGNEADVFVKVWVTKEGKVKKVVVYKSSNMLFNRAAAEAAMQWEFTPAILKGKPVSVWVSIPFRFRIRRGCVA